MVCFDPFYKVLAREQADEVSAVDVSRVLGEIDRIAECGPAVLLIHHTTKGRSGDKQLTDRGSGSGVMARDYDAAFTLSPHQDHPAEWTVLEAVLRNHPSPAARTVEFRNGLFVVRDDVLPQVETSLTAKRAQQSGPSPEELSAKVAEWIATPTKTADIIDRIRSEFSIGEKKAEAVIRQLERGGFTRSRTSTFPCHWIIAPPDQQDKPPVQRGLGME